MAHSASDKYALNITILRPDKLDYGTLRTLVDEYIKHTNRWPDLIEFTPTLMKRFKDCVGGEGEKENEFLGIPCIVDPAYIIRELA